MDDQNSSLHESKLRVVHVLHALNGRAIAEVVTVIAEQMAARGHEVVLVANVRTDEASPLPDGVACVDLSGPSQQTVSSVPAFRRTLRRLRPDVVYAHGNGPVRASVLATRFLRRRPRLIGVEHNHYSSYPWNLPRLRFVLNRLLLPRTDLMFGVSDGVVDDLEEQFPALVGKLRVVPAPLTRFDRMTDLAAEPVEHPWFGDSVPVVSTVGHIHPRKDHQTLVRAMARVREVAGDSAARLVIIGNDDGAEADRLRRLIAELELGEAVALLGEKRNPLRYVARSTVFALSSRNEGMGIAILEAMALGTPVVSTDCPSGPAWLLDEGRHGTLVPVGDDVALGDAIVELLRSETLRARYRSSALTRVDEFAPASVAGWYLDAARPSPSGGTVA